MFRSLTLKDWTATVRSVSSIGNVVRWIYVTEEKAASHFGFDGDTGIPKVGLSPFFWNGTINHHGRHSTGVL